MIFHFLQYELVVADEMTGACCSADEPLPVKCIDEHRTQVPSQSMSYRHRMNDLNQGESSTSHGNATRYT